ncbi:hypothetical protein QTP70_007454 [Hemibagrus guttatus]|uniref:Uncharacterized protein n=1 Tax=Hemibagrus guttatus TaxID=175788 RepID=A0AAE0PX48_9TELE|nr:hypothetical protein QTP70_007454 [Hemibagrus guttatus]
MKERLECWEEIKKESSEKTNRKTEIVKWFEIEGERQRAFGEDRREKATAPPAEELVEQKPPPYREMSDTQKAGIYVLTESERPQRVSLEILDGHLEGQVICRPSEDEEEKTAQRSEQEPKRVYPKLQRFQEESLAWDPELGVETEEWKEHQENLRKVIYKEDIQWLNLGCQTSTPYPGNERREGRQPPEASEKEGLLTKSDHPSEGKDEERKTSISTQYEENRETEPMEKEKIPPNQEEKQDQCNEQEEKEKAESEEEGKYHLAGVVTLTPTVTELRRSEIQRIREEIQGMRRRLDVSALTVEDLKWRIQIQSSMEVEETKRRLRGMEQEMERRGSAQRQVEGAVKYLYDSHSEFLKQSQAESGEKEEDRHQFYQEVRKMQEELDRRLNKTADELKAVWEWIKEKEQQRAKKSVVISTIITKSKKQRPDEEEGEKRKLRKIRQTRQLKTRKRPAEVIRETGRKVLGVSSGRRKEDEEVQDSIQRKRLAKKKWDMDRTEENRQEYKELQRRVKREVSKAKQKAYDELYTRLDTREGEKDLYRLARQRDRDGKDVQQVRVIKDRDGRVLTSEESVQRRWKEYFEELMNEENEREKRVEGVNSVEQKVDQRESRGRCTRQW